MAAESGAYGADAAALHVGVFLDFWDRHRPFPLAGDGECIVSFPGTSAVLRRSDLLALIAGVSPGVDSGGE